MEPTEHDHGEAVLERAGYELRTASHAVVGDPRGGTRRLTGTDRPLAVVALDDPQVEPAALVPEFASVLAHGHDALFVVPDVDALAAVVEVLDRPYCVAAEDEDRCRTFYDGPDRVPLANGHYALAPAGDLVWRERDPPEADDGDRTGSDRKQVVLEDGDEILARFDDVDALACPSADAFPLSYKRGGDKTFHVYDRWGSELGRFGTIKAMRQHDFEPVAMPLVPEHSFDDGSLVTSWAVVVEGASTVHTADGTTQLPEA
ncbi:hypothetical protein [Haloarchaeobius iranensis]|uniref:Uncharacterized protein n=1 Tax=Haloarchaeobius iranensis TaxID=996166 RepID=A0A1G9SXU5_9EURY|nr:hypothetical protein [Haloarchaeobius iranensis]SDM40250.1 hypothetical protein SAMN05192554_10223 [Haloarchaeobius iranensis]